MCYIINRSGNFVNLDNLLTLYGGFYKDSDSNGFADGLLTVANVVGSLSDSTQTCSITNTVTEAPRQCFLSSAVVQNNKYFAGAYANWITQPTTINQIRVGSDNSGSGSVIFLRDLTGSTALQSGIFTAPSSLAYVSLIIRCTGDSARFKFPLLFDLTKAFGEGREPTDINKINTVIQNLIAVRRYQPNYKVARKLFF